MEQKNQEKAAKTIPVKTDVVNTMLREELEPPRIEGNQVDKDEEEENEEEEGNNHEEGGDSSDKPSYVS